LQGCEGADLPELNTDQFTFALITQFTGSWAFTKTAYSSHQKITFLKKMLVMGSRVQQNMGMN